MKCQTPRGRTEQRWVPTTNDYMYLYTRSVSLSVWALFFDLYLQATPAHLWSIRLRHFGNKSDLKSWSFRCSKCGKYFDNGPSVRRSLFRQFNHTSCRRLLGGILFDWLATAPFAWHCDCIFDCLRTSRSCSPPHLANLVHVGNCITCQPPTRRFICSFQWAKLVGMERASRRERLLIAPKCGSN